MTGLRKFGRSARSAIFDVGVAGSVGLLSLVQFGAGRLTMSLIGGGMATALLVRRRFPLTVMGVVSALALLQVLRYEPGIADPMPFDVAVLIAMYSVVKYSCKIRDGLIAAVPVTIGVGIETVRHGKPGTWWVELLFLGAVSTAVWVSGYSVRTRRLYVAGLEDRAARAERERDHLTRLAVADERASIARELHDVVAHSLAVMIVQADGASYALDGEPEQARLAIKQVASTGREALEDMRRLVGVLRGTAEQGEPEDDRRRIDLDHLTALIDRARSAGLAVNLTTEGERPAVPPAVELTVYRIAQEALTNVLRHAGPAAAVQVRLAYRAGAVQVEVEDDGGGQLATGPAGHDGHGLVGMRERVAVHGGRCSAGPRLGGGWQITAEVPFERASGSGS